MRYALFQFIRTEKCRLHLTRLFISLKIKLFLLLRQRQGITHRIKLIIKSYEKRNFPRVW